MSKKLKVFTLSLKKWLRGNRCENSMLHATDTHQECCLGQFGRQCGIPISRLSDRCTPWDVVQDYEVRRRLAGDFELLVDRERCESTNDAQRAMKINDDASTSDTTKIKALRPIFRKWGYRIEVVE